MCGIGLVNEIAQLAVSYAYEVLTTKEVWLRTRPGAQDVYSCEKGQKV